MKKTQWITFTIVLLIACFSAYSLAQMNQVYKIEYSWCDGSSYIEKPRLTFGEWTSPKYTNYMDFAIITDNNQMITINGTSTIKMVNYPNVDFDNEFLLFATLGEVNGKGYSIKVKNIAQRGNIVEVMVDMAHPKEYNLLPFNKDYPYDIVKIPKSQIVLKGDLTFIFKNYNGAELYRKECNIENKII